MMVLFPSRCVLWLPLRAWDVPPTTHRAPEPPAHAVWAPRRRGQDTGEGGERAHPPRARRERLLIEHLVAEVVRPGPEAVLARRPLVVREGEGGSPGHHRKDGHHDEDRVSGSRARLRTWMLTCGERDGYGCEVRPGREGRSPGPVYRLWPQCYELVRAERRWSALSTAPAAW